MNSSCADSAPQGTMRMTRTHRVEWGECDPLGIIFYPTYFRWIDTSTHELFRQAGHDMRSLRSEFGLEGPVIVDAGASFLAPIAFGDEILAEAWIGTWRDKTFRVEHRFSKDGQAICAGHELRAWAVRHEGGMRAEPIPERFRLLFNT